jgi:tetratricopeptide (TPR) repeat protein
VEKDLETIENYLAGTLEAAQKAQVENRIDTDPSFAQKVSLVKETRDVLKIDVEGFRKDLETIEEEFAANRWSIHQFFKENSYLMAAAVALIAVVGVSYLIWFQNPPTSELFAANFQIPPENITTRADLESNALSKGLRAYSEENYLSANEQFEQILTTDPNNQAVLFYSGICHLTLSEEQQAIDKFERIITDGPGEYLTAAKWYLGLTYLKLEDLLRSKVVLEELYQSESGTYAARAGDLLDSF